MRKQIEMVLPATYREYALDALDVCKDVRK